MTDHRPDGHHVRLAADLRVGAGRVHLDLAPGQGHLLDGDAGPAAVAALTGLPAGTVASGRGQRVRRGRHRIHLDGRRLHGLPPAARVRRGLGMLVGAPVAAHVTVADHLAAVAGTRRAAALLDGAPLLAGRGHQPAGILSGGERRVLAWLRCLATGPRAVVLDAPGTGLDRATLDWAGEQVAAWRSAGVTVVIRPGRPDERAWLER